MLASAVRARRQEVRAVFIDVGRVSIRRGHIRHEAPRPSLEVRLYLSLGFSMLHHRQSHEDADHRFIDILGGR